MNIIELSIKYKQLLETYNFYLNSQHDINHVCKIYILDNLWEEINRIQKLIYELFETK